MTKHRSTPSYKPPKALKPPKTPAYKPPKPAKAPKPPKLPKTTTIHYTGKSGAGSTSYKTTVGGITRTDTFRTNKPAKHTVTTKLGGGRSHTTSISGGKMRSFSTTVAKIGSTIFRRRS